MMLCIMVFSYHLLHNYNVSVEFMSAMQGVCGSDESTLQLHCAQGHSEQCWINLLVDLTNSCRCNMGTSHGYSSV